MDNKSVWTEFISARKARKVARALVDAGYTTATAEKCNGYVINVAHYFEPDSNVADHGNVLRLICAAAGIQPKQDGSHE